MKVGLPFHAFCSASLQKQLAQVHALLATDV
jgi:hypothetical protein